MREKLWDKYRLTLEWFREQIAAQGNKCFLCRDTFDSPGPAKDKVWPCIDHDHDTMVVRKILCHSCNSALGLFKEDPELMRKAADYVVHFSE